MKSARNGGTLYEQKAVRQGGEVMALRHLFPQKVNLNQCFRECKYLQRVFTNAGMSRLLYCTHKDISLKHSDKKTDCKFYRAQENEVEE